MAELEYVLALKNFTPLELSGKNRILVARREKVLTEPLLENVCKTMVKLWVRCEEDKDFHTAQKFLRAWEATAYVAYCEKENQVVGYAWLCQEDVDVPKGTIHYVSVTPSMRHQDIATDMVRILTRLAKWSMNLLALGLTSDPKLRALYEGLCGFTVVE